MNHKFITSIHNHVLPGEIFGTILTTAMKIIIQRTIQPKYKVKSCVEQHI